jgi:hypothetical protein
MRTGSKTVRKSVTLPSKVAAQVRNLAKDRKPSASRMLIDLAERFRTATDPKEVRRLGDQMGRMVFGD